MWNALFVKLWGGGNKAMTAVKAFGVLLSVDIELLTVEMSNNFRNRVIHKTGAKPLATAKRENSAELYAVLCTIGSKISHKDAILFEKAVESIVIESVEILTDNALFKEKNGLTGTEDLVKLTVGERRKDFYFKLQNDYSFSV